jgi:predicted amidohydrolase
MIKIASAQYQLKKHDSLLAYMTSVREWVEEATQEKADILLFPEYGSIEIVSLMNEAIQKNLKHQLDEIQNYREIFIDLYQHLSSEFDVVIVAPSFPLKINEKVFINRTFVFKPDGELQYQDKQMMTRFEDESWKVSSPEKCELTIFEVKKIKVGVSICFDIEFPDFSRALCQKGAEIILAPSCTETLKGMNRVHVGARARSLENQCLVVVSQTVGVVDYSEAIDVNNGKSAFYAPPDLHFSDDGIIAEGPLNRSQWLYYSYEREKFLKVRTDGAVLNFKKISQLPSILFSNSVK